MMETGSRAELIRLQNGLYNSLFQTQQIQNDQKSREETLYAPSSTSKSELNKTSNIEYCHSEGGGSSLTNSSTLNQVSITKGHALENTKVHAPSFWRLLYLNMPEWKQATMGCFSAVLFGAVQPVYSFALGGMISVYFLMDHNEIKKETKTYAVWFIGLLRFRL